MLSSLLEFKLRFVDSDHNFLLLDASVKQSDRQLPFDGLISPRHLNGTPLDLCHSFLIGGDLTLLTTCTWKPCQETASTYIEELEDTALPPLLPMIILPLVVTVH
jgi:hypothetical protein